MPDASGRFVNTETRRLAAIMFTDIVGFSRQMGADEARMLRLLEVHQQIVQQAVAEYRGHVIKTTGDGFLVDFPSVVHAVQCAQQVQARLRTYNTHKEQTEQIHVRIGIHLGDIVQKDNDVFGDGVNIASRLQELAAPDSTCISHIVYQEVAKKLVLGTVISLGRPKLKNIAERFAIYALLREPPQGLRQTLQVQRLKFSRRVGTAHRVLAGGLLTAGVILLIWYLALPTLRTQPSGPAPDAAPAALPLPDKPSLVVLPFVNMSGDPEQEYFSDGITEDLTSAFSRVSGLFVISRNTAFFYKGKAIKIPELGKELGVRYVLEGSIRKADGQVRITTQLIDATQDYHLWTERYDRPLKDIFALQDEIVQKIVTTLQLQLTLWEQGALPHKTTKNLEAYDYYLRGWSHNLRLTKEANAQARQLLEKAIALDPQYAEAYVALGWVSFSEWSYQWSPNPQKLEEAFKLGQKALALDDALPLAHCFAGHVSLFKKQHEQAIAEEERAIALDPNSALGYAELGLALTYAARPEEAIGVIEKAMRLNPRSFIFPVFLSFALHFVGRDKEAIATLKSALLRNPDYMDPHVQLAAIYSELGREAEAQAEAAEVQRLSPNASLEVVGQRLPFKDPATTERYLAALRKAGLK